MTPGRCRVAMVGAGRIAYEGHLPAYRANADLLEVVAVVDPDAERRALVAAALPNAPVSVPSLQDAFKSTDVDLIVIASPPGAHRAAAMAALDRGVAVVSEKPLCSSLDELDALRAAAGRDGYVCVMHNYLYKPGWRALLDIVSSGRIGRPFMARFEELGWDHWRAPYGAWRETTDQGGPLRDNLYHVVYLAERVFGSAVTEAGATQAALVHAYRGGDVALLDLVHANGALTQATSAWCFTGQRRGVAEVVGTEATVRYCHWERPAELVVERDAAVEIVPVPGWEEARESGYVDAFRDAIERAMTGEPPPCGIEAASRVLTVLQQASGEVVRRPRWWRHRWRR